MASDPKRSFLPFGHYQNDKHALYGPFPRPDEDVINRAATVVSQINKAKLAIDGAAIVAVGRSSNKKYYLAFSPALQSALAGKTQTIVPPGCIHATEVGANLQQILTACMKSATTGSPGCAEKKIISQMLADGEVLDAMAVLGVTDKDAEALGGHMLYACTAGVVAAPCPSCCEFLRNAMIKGTHSEREKARAEFQKAESKKAEMVKKSVNTIAQPSISYASMAKPKQAPPIVNKPDPFPTLQSTVGPRANTAAPKQAPKQVPGVWGKPPGGNPPGGTPK